MSTFECGITWQRLLLLAAPTKKAATRYSE